jgi:integrase/recombinase XerD
MDDLDNAKQEHSYELAKNRLLANKDLSEKEKTLVIEFCERLVNSRPLSPARKVSICNRLNRALAWMGADITEATLEDYNKLEREILTRKKCMTVKTGKRTFKLVETEEKYSKSTQYDFRKDMKALVHWLREEKELDIPDPGKKIFHLGRSPNPVTENDVLTLEEAQEFLSTIKNPMHKALFSVSVFDCLRPHEVRSLKIKDIKLDGDRPHILVPEETKTGWRTVYIYESTNALMAWLEVHPGKDNPEAYAFLSRNNKRMTNAYAIKLTKEYYKKAGIGKPPKPYNLRHTAITLSVKRVGRDLTKKKAGHKLSSAIIDRYAHLTNEDLANAEDRARGIENGKEEKKTTVQCFTCKAVNNSGSTRCYRCKRPLHIEDVWAQLDEAQTLMERFKQLSDSGTLGFNEQVERGYREKVAEEAKRVMNKN